MAPHLAESRQKLIDAAVSVFGEYGFRGATTRRIAESAGVNEVTLFRLFGSKGALLEEAVRESQTATARRADAHLPDEPAEVEAELTAWAREQWRSMRERRAVIRKMMGEVEEHPHISACLTEGWERIHGAVTRYLERLRERRQIDPDVSIQTAVAMLNGVLFADAIGRDIKRNAYPPERVAVTEYTKLFLRAVGYTPRPHTPNGAAR
jgi:AcrR family transcriptional regulator